MGRIETRRLTRPDVSAAVTTRVDELIGVALDRRRGSSLVGRIDARRTRVGRSTRVLVLTSAEWQRVTRLEVAGFETTPYKL